MNRTRTQCFLLLLLLGFLANHPAAASQVPRVTVLNAGDYVDERATVCGVVTSSSYASSTRGQPTFINLDEHPDTVFTLVIWGENRHKFVAPEKTYKDKKVCVTGIVETYQEKLQIVVTEPSQIAIDTSNVNTNATSSQQESLSDAEIRRNLIQQSISRYSGSCPCPYNRDRGGRRCGGRSAYSRPGGASPLCYDSDITDQMINDFRRRYE